MYRKISSESKKRAGKRIFLSGSCLILLSGMVTFLAYAVGMGMEGKEIDNIYPPMVGEGSGGDDIKALRNYEEGWRSRFSRCMKNYKSECLSSSDKELADEYLAAVLEAAEAQNDLMEYVGVEEEEQLWYSAQIYRCAYEQDVRGETGHGELDNEIDNLPDNWQAIVNTNSITGNVRFSDEFMTNIDKEFIKSLNEENEGDSREGQEKFNIDWSNQLCSLTLKFYENLDEEGKRLANIWQESREKWKEASSNCFWPPSGKDCPEGARTAADRMEKDGWINRLYFWQLKSMMESRQFSELL